MRPHPYVLQWTNLKTDRIIRKVQAGQCVWKYTKYKMYKSTQESTHRVTITDVKAITQLLDFAFVSKSFWKKCNWLTLSLRGRLTILFFLENNTEGLKKISMIGRYFKNLRAIEQVTSRIVFILWFCPHCLMVVVNWLSFKCSVLLGPYLFQSTKRKKWF
jgi:hypothetical protein